MKKNITINLCGRLYQIDEDAYEMLQHYIQSLHSAFDRQEGGEEIVDDIEARIAELFDELKQKAVYAITIDHVKEIIARIGEPEQLKGEEETTGEDQEKATADNWQDKARSAAQDLSDNVRARVAGKKLFRNPKDKMLAGVLSGFAAYTNTDAIIWRIATLLLFFFYGFGLLLYIILAIVIPEARTPEQLLQMEGKEVTPQNLADAVLEKNDQTEKRPGLLRSLFSLLLKIVTGFFIAIALLVCVVLGIAFLFTLVVMVSALTLPISSEMPFSLETMGLTELYQTNPLLLIGFLIALFALLLIPIYATVHLLLSLTNKVQPMGMGQRIAWVVLWIAALCAIVPCSITMAEYADKHDRILRAERQRQYDEQHTYQGVKMNEVDMTFLRQGGWNLLKADDCDHFTWSGSYPTGDRRRRYLDTYDDDCEAILQVERQQAVTPGIYRMDCLVRAEGPGTFVYVQGKEKHLAEIPAYDNKPAGLYDMLKAQLTDSLKQNTITLEYLNLDLDVRDIRRHRKELDSWSVVTIENIVCEGDSLAYGMSSDAAFTGKPCRAKWFSATDFTLTRTGDLPTTVKKGRK